MAVRVIQFIFSFKTNPDEGIKLLHLPKIGLLKL